MPEYAGLNVWIWMALGVGLIAAEALVPGLVLLWFGIGALVSGLIFAAWDTTLYYQLLVWAVTSLVALGVGRGPLKRWSESRQGDTTGMLNARGNSLIGHTATLHSAIVEGQGRVRIADSDWSVSGPDLPVGTKVRITAVEGNTLIVVPLDT